MIKTSFIKIARQVGNKSFENPLGIKFTILYITTNFDRERTGYKNNKCQKKYEGEYLTCLRSITPLMEFYDQVEAVN